MMRSQIIYETIDLESAVERIITFHFCPATEKQDLFVSLMFENGQISLKQKIGMLRKLLRLCYPELHTAFLFLPKHLDKLRELRNDFAHLRLDLPAEPGSTDLDAEAVKLRKLKDGQQTIREVTRKEVDTIVRQCRDLTIAAMFLGMAVQRAARGEQEEEFTQMIVALGQQIGKRLKDAAG